MTSPDLIEANIAKIAELFPSVVTEISGGGGEPQRAIDFDLLRQELSDHIVEGPQERYRLDWPGKRAAAFAANAPIAKTLRPMREESVNFDSTKNLFIEGDNLEALKLLQESYLGKVKLIYIDPPYNTGHDFVYADDFSQSREVYLESSGQVDETGARLVANTESNGRFHSDWLSMMYPRLKLARNLLADDGVLAISIDDNEIARLKCVCDELFGTGAHLGTLVWRRRVTTDSRNASRVSVDHEYVVLYSRSIDARLRGKSIDVNKYSNPDGDPRGPWMSVDLSGLASESQRPNLHFTLVDPGSGREFLPNPNRGWSKGPETMRRLVEENRILWPSSDKGRPREKKFLSELLSQVTGFSTWLTMDMVGVNANATRELRNLLGGKLFDFSKPIGLICLLVEQVTFKEEEVVLDFFAGSSTTAHAVMAANAADGGNRRFIMVQLDEVPDPKSEAAKQGYASIAELSRERIRRAGRKILEDLGKSEDELDIGFRSFKISSTNLNEVFATPDETEQFDLGALASNIKPGRTGEDLLVQIMLDWGLELSLPIRVETLLGHTIHLVDDDALLACFDEEVPSELIRAMAERHPLRAVFRDDAFSADAERINAEQIFRELSPHTDIRVI